MRKLVLFLFVTALALLLIKKKDMTLRQSLMKAAYPLIMLKSKLFPDRDAVLANPSQSSPPVSFYELTATGNDGKVIGFDQFKGKKVMIVNTASDCGYTGQFEELEKLHQQNKDLVILGFPANDFKEQEKGDNASIAQFCKINYGVTFPLMQKTRVIRNEQQDAVFHWLSHKEKNGWCDQAPTWNFSKYVIDEKGVLQAFFKQTVSPLDERVKRLLEK